MFASISLLHKRFNNIWNVFIMLHTGIVTILKEIYRILMSYLSIMSEGLCRLKCLLKINVNECLLCIRLQISLQFSLKRFWTWYAPPVVYFSTHLFLYCGFNVLILLKIISNLFLFSLRIMFLLVYCPELRLVGDIVHFVSFRASLVEFLASCLFTSEEVVCSLYQAFAFRTGPYDLS